MKQKETTKPYGKIQSKKTSFRDIFINTLTILLFASAFTWMGVRVYRYERDERKADEEYKASLPMPGAAIKHSLVCMVNNTYMGNDQIPVLVNGRTYYGCCPKCVTDLNTDESTRIAVDPFSKKVVDKARSFISINPDKKGAILYFESEGNAKKYLTK